MAEGGSRSLRDPVLVALCLLGLVAWFRQETEQWNPPRGYAAALSMLAADSGVVDALGAPVRSAALRGFDPDGDLLEFTFALAAPLDGVRIRLSIDSMARGWRARQLAVFRPETTFVRMWGYPDLPPGPIAPPSLAERARRAYFDDRHDEALTLASRALARDPGSAEALTIRAWVHQARRRYGAALLDFEAAVRADSRSYEALYGYGLELGRARRYGESIDVLNRATILHPDRSGAYYVRAVAWGRLGDERRQLADLRASCARGGETACGVLDREGLGR